MTENITNYQDNSPNPGTSRGINTLSLCPYFASSLFGALQQNDETARRTLDRFMAITQHRIPDFKITNEPGLYYLATRMGIDIADKKLEEIAENLAALLLLEFKKQGSELFFTSLVPAKRMDVWRQQEVVPRGIEQEIAEVMRLTQDVNGHDFELYIKTSIRASLADDLGSNIINTEIQDILFGTPLPVLIQKDPGVEFIGGFSAEAIRLFGGHFRTSYRPVLDNIVSGRIRGVAALVGSSGQNDKEDGVALVRDLIKNDILVLQTGSSAFESARAGLMVPEASTLAGAGLASVCEAVGIPPVLHFGSDDDFVRILMIALDLVKEGSLNDVSDLPLAVSLLGETDGNTLSIGLSLTALGLFTFMDSDMSASVPGDLIEFMQLDAESMYGGKWVLETDPSNMAGVIISHIDRKRKSLGIDKARERVLFDMAMRRGIE
jgi:hydroxylamine reductase (hybrid-cluster protein)